MNWNIGNIVIKNRVALAPMAGISSPAYMKIVEEMGCGYAVTELISAEAIVRNNKKTLEMLKGIEKIKMPVGIQLFGSNATVLANAAKIIVALYPNVFIDLNFGCPVPKVAIRAESGSALLKYPEKIGEIVKKVVSSVNVCVTVKIRSGWDEKSINAPLIAKICEENKASAIVVHARTRAQGYSGLADWSIIKRVKESVNIPVIGNGDITSHILAKKMLEETSCDAIMIGRAAVGNPWLIKECVYYLENNELLPSVSGKEKISMLRKHYDILKEVRNENIALLEIRTPALGYLKGLPDNKIYKEKICSVKNEKEFLNILDEYESILKSE